jgi:hypothetical protein
MRPFLILVIVFALLAAPHAVRGDAFDNYTNVVLAKVPTAVGVLPLKQLTPGLMVEHAGVLPDASGALAVVRTNDGRWSKLLVQPARQKLPDKSTAPILLIERFVTYQEGEERTVVAAGSNVRLFDGFQFNLDMGQVVPPAVGGDLRYVAAGGKAYVEPVGKAALYLVTRPLPEASPKKTEKMTIGSKFEPRYFDGAYKLFDDGRRSGTLHLKVLPGGDVQGSYYSDKDGQKYEVSGKVGDAPQAIEFTITYPRSRQVFTGLMFTGDGRAIAGSSLLQERKAGFYAVRIEDK